MKGQIDTVERQRGAMLVEVLVALLILLLIMVGVMQLFATALVSDRGADARTELSFKAQQVVEVLRMANSIARTSGGTLPTALNGTTGLSSLPIAGTQAYTELPKTSSDAYWGFWGPGGTGVIDDEGARYVLGYQITDGDTTGVRGAWVITVTAQPKNPGRYLDVRGNKVVRYVAAIPK